MMKPYYEQDGITIYHGDCREVMAALPLASQDLAVTSPPYNKGIRLEGHWQGPPSAGGKARRFRKGYGDFADAMPLDVYCEWQQNVLRDLWRLISETGAVFYNHKPRIINGELWTPLCLNPGLPLRQIIQWNTGPGVNFMPGAFMPAHEWVMLFAKPGFRLAARELSRMSDVWAIPPAASVAGHTCPFPLELPTRAIRATTAASVIDPFMGTGTTLEAAALAGIRAIGIEQHEPFCEFAANRLRQGVLFGAAQTKIA